MELSFHLVSNLNIYNLAFVSMTQTLKDIKEQQVSQYQRKVLCDSIQLSMERNTQKLTKRIENIRQLLKYEKNIVDREMVIAILHIVETYEENIFKLKKILADPIDCSTYEKCCPIFSEMDNKMQEIITVLQSDLDINTRAIF